MKFRLMHVKPDGVNRTWDIILMDDRQNARVHLNPEGSEFIDLVILEGGGYKEVSLNPPRLGERAMPLEPVEKSGDFIIAKDNILKL